MIGLFHPQPGSFTPLRCVQDDKGRLRSEPALSIAEGTTRGATFTVRIEDRAEAITKTHHVGIIPGVH
jgi:hypothetical protein